MASAVVLPLLLLFVVLSGSTASVADQHAAGVDEINYIVLQTSSWLKPETVCSGLSIHYITLSPPPPTIFHVPKKVNLTYIYIYILHLFFRINKLLYYFGHYITLSLSLTPILHVPTKVNLSHTHIYIYIHFICLKIN